MKGLPKIPNHSLISHPILVSQQIPDKFFTVSSTFQKNLLLGYPEGYAVCGVKIQLLTQFIVPGSTSFIVRIGNTNTVDLYASQFELTGAVTPTALQFTHSNFTNNVINTNEDKDVYATFTANGSGYLKNIAQGEVEITILYRKI